MESRPRPDDNAIAAGEPDCRWHEDMSDRTLWSWIGLTLAVIFIAGFICGAVLA